MARLVARDPWFLGRKPSPDVGVRLFCFPSAGGGASMFRGWNDAFPTDIEVNAVQLPGRETRLKESRIPDVGALVREVTHALAPYLDRPFALFGYSMGALLAFEVARELRRRGWPVPGHLFVAAMRAPQTAAAHPPSAHLPREDFLEYINRYFQPSDEAWKIPDLVDLILPILRDDISAVDRYAYVDEPPLSCPIDGYAGADDRVTPLPSAKAWRHQTAAEFELTVFCGGHFFLHDALSDLQRSIRGRMIRLIEDC